MLGNVIDARGVLALLAFAAICFAAARATRRTLSIAAHAMMLAMCGLLFLHLMPGFDNPRLVTNVVLGPGSMPYTKYLNVDKGMAGLILLAVYAPRLVASDEGLRHVPGFLWRFAVLIAVVLPMALALGYVQWDPKLPAWWPAWIASMVFLTALPEEALFRGVVQTSIARWMGDTPRATTMAIVAASALFGLAHIAGGPAYVLLSSMAGIGYGWIYASTRSIAAAIAAHAGLNTVHFLLFSYPALSIT